MKQRYIVVLAKDTHEGNVYAKRAGLPRFTYRVATSANSIRKLQVADVHRLPGFLTRRDRHAIMAELRWARDVKIIDVEMPAAPEAKTPEHAELVVGEQLELPEAEEALVGTQPEAVPTADPEDVVTEVELTDDTSELDSLKGADWDADGDPLTDLEAAVSMFGGPDAPKTEEPDGEEAGTPEPSEDAAPAPEKRKRRSRCRICSQLVWDAQDPAHDGAAHDARTADLPTPEPAPAGVGMFD